MILSRRVLAVGTTLAIAVPTAASTASAATTHHKESAATKACQLQDKKLGKKAFDKKYGAKDAMGKCVAVWAKHHGTTKAKKK